MIQKYFVYHRALNTEDAFRNFLEKQENSKHQLAAEGDICWTYIDGEFIIYIHHPDVQGKSLSDEKIVSLLKNDELFTLEKLFKINSNVNFILELKTGRGNIEGFFLAFKALLDKYSVKNIIIDAFSVEQLKGVKRVIPQIKTSMHTKFIWDKYVLESTFEKPYVRIHNVYKMDYIDYFTISFKTTHVNLLNLDVDKAYKKVFEAKKGLNLGAIKDMQAFSKALSSKAEYIYLRSKEVLANYEDLL
ncbi:MAG: hypothetical protein JXQ67_06005 [Campylobacterales bacterium]|nr:hypothetical protein [Campylobacterales bacterium]